MKIFNIGLNKTGTISLTAALKTLGFNANHDNNINERMIEELKKDDFTTVNQFDAFGDYPLWLNCELLLNKFPRAFFICTTRDKEEWMQSRIVHCLSNRVFNKGTWRDINTQEWSEEYDDFHSEVDRLFKDHTRFLMMDITEGDKWDKLCPFFGIPSPEEKFPAAHSSFEKLIHVTEAFKKRLISKLNKNNDH